jgi:hypothetical protein
VQIGIMQADIDPDDAARAGPSLAPRRLREFVAPPFDFSGQHFNASQSRWNRKS